MISSQWVGAAWNAWPGMAGTGSGGMPVSYTLPRNMGGFESRLYVNKEFIIMLSDAGLDTLL